MRLVLAGMIYVSTEAYFFYFLGKQLDYTSLMARHGHVWPGVAKFWPVEGG